MIKHSKFPKIGQYRQVIKEVQMMSAYVGKDELGNAMYDNTKPKPKLRFKGFVKLHGTNAGVGHNPIDGLWVQSRSNVITPTNDNAGFATFVEGKKGIFNDMIENVRYTEKGKIGENDGIVIFGEWAGGGIQKGVAITGIEKSFFIFDVKILPENGDDPYYVESYYLKDEENRVYNIDDYLSYDIEIDFNRPDLSQAKLIEITEAVERLCPVGKAFLDNMSNNTAYEENGKIWFEKEIGFQLEFKKALKDKFKELRVDNPIGVNYIKFISEK